MSYKLRIWLTESPFGDTVLLGRTAADYLRREFSYSQYQQIMTLPEDADREHIDAKVENGVLTVNIPKIVKKPQEAHKLIEVK